MGSLPTASYTTAAAAAAAAVAAINAATTTTTTAAAAATTTTTTPCRLDFTCTKRPLVSPRLLRKSVEGNVEASRIPIIMVRASAYTCGIGYGF